MKILTILGARPQFIKAGAVSREIKRQKEEGRRLKEIIVHTGQHYDANMSDIFFEELHLPKPDYFLGIGGKSHGAMTGQMMEKIEEVALKEKADIIMVYGDTNSTLAGALVGAKLHIPIAHVEAGLRSFNMNMPEEINRILTDRVSKWLFCPTETAVNNLKKEGFPFPTYQSTNTPITNNQKLETKNYQLITNVGDVMLDVAMYYKKFAKKPKVVDSFSFLVSSNNQQPKTKNFILCTVHRAENTDNIERLKSIFEALSEIAKDTQIILPLHPRTRKIVSSFWSLVFSKETNSYYFQTKNQKPKTKNLIIIDPVGYLEMVWLLDNCDMVITDSGGLQKEAYFFKKPCITLRDETEWVELVDIRANTLVGADKDRIVSSFWSLVSSQNKPKTKNQKPKTNLYGDGKASKMIIKEILK
jgi:UDP-GlcNAc3NAcA epimerase